MKLYHFTSGYHIEGCKKEGLTLGVIPVSIDPPKFIPGFQWLTKNGKFDQEWCKYSTLPYQRNEYRITIKIPKSARKNLIPWLFYYEKKKHLMPMAAALNLYGDPENWYLFKGIVKPEWFKKVARNPRFK